MSWGEHTVVISNLPAHTSEEGIATLLKDSGTVMNIIFRGPSSAFVVFSEVAATAEAITKHHDTQPGTAPQKIQVEPATSEQFEAQLLMLMRNPPQQPVIKVEPPPAALPTAAAMAPSYGNSHNSSVRISTFSGDGAKGEVSYEQFRQELMSLKKQRLSPDTILNALTRSLRGTAAVTMLSLGDIDHINLETILAEFDSLFGITLPPEKLYTAFFAAEQKDAETVTGWSSRLKHLLHQLKRSGVHFPDEIITDILRTKFCSGLRETDIRVALRHKFDSGETYEQLLVAARTAELETHEMKTARSNLTAVHDPLADLSSKLDAVLQRFDGLDARIGRLEKSGADTSQRTRPMNQPTPASSPQDSASAHYPRKPRGQCNYCHQHGHWKSDCPSLNGNKSALGGNQLA